MGLDRLCPRQARSSQVSGETSPSSQGTEVSQCTCNLHCQRNWQPTQTGSGRGTRGPQLWRWCDDLSRCALVATCREAMQWCACVRYPSELCAASSRSAEHRRGSLAAASRQSAARAKKAAFPRCATSVFSTCCRGRRTCAPKSGPKETRREARRLVTKVSRKDPQGDARGYDGADPVGEVAGAPLTRARQTSGRAHGTCCRPPRPS